MMRILLLELPLNLPCLSTRHRSGPRRMTADSGTWKACHVLLSLCSSLAIASYKVDTCREPGALLDSKLRCEVPA